MSDIDGGTWLQDGKIVKASERKQPSGFQFVWWGWAEVFAADLSDLIQWHRYYDPQETSWAYIYSWRIVILPFEIRRWAPPFDVVRARTRS